MRTPVVESICPCLRIEIRLHSVLWEHCTDVHSGNMVDFKMSVIKRYKNDAMMRQIMESVIIESSDQGELLNTKQEWNYISFPRIDLS